MSTELTFPKNDFGLSIRYRTVRKATTISLLFTSLISHAQQSSFPLDKLDTKNQYFRVSYIPAKSFTSLAHDGSDSAANYKPRISSVPGFYISQAEVTNWEYRGFIQYARDSAAHVLLQHYREVTNSIDWSKPIDWKDDRLEPLLISPDDRVNGKKELDPARIKFELDIDDKKEIVSVYPDTLVWISDFSYSYNESLVKRYFSSAEFDDYPVVGISLKQAMAFCQWKTEQVNRSLKRERQGRYEVYVKLPTNAEWESAAMEEKDNPEYMTGHKYNCNFGSIIDASGLTVKGNKDDGYFYTGPVRSFPAGPYGLYDMKGNIAEWTCTSRDEIVDVEVKPEKKRTSYIAKGGGWNSPPYYMQVGVCQFFPVMAAHSYLGFRYVVYVVHK